LPVPGHRGRIPGAYRLDDKPIGRIRAIQDGATDAARAAHALRKADEVLKDGRADAASASRAVGDADEVSDRTGADTYRKKQTVGSAR
jgi:hypothetical protein